MMGMHQGAFNGTECGTSTLDTVSQCVTNRTPPPSKAYVVTTHTPHRQITSSLSLYILTEKVQSYTVIPEAWQRIPFYSGEHLF